MKELYLKQAREQLSRLRERGFINLQRIIADYYDDLISFGYTAEFAGDITAILTSEYYRGRAVSRD